MKNTKTIKKALIIGGVVLAGILIAGMTKFNVINDDVYITQKDGTTVRVNDLDEYVFTTQNGYTGIFAYTSREKDFATLDIDGEFYQLQQTPSASGIKYTNQDQSVVYWEHQGEATISIGKEEFVTKTIEKLGGKKNQKNN